MYVETRQKVKQDIGNVCLNKTEDILSTFSHTSLIPSSLQNKSLFSLFSLLAIPSSVIFQSSFFFYSFSIYFPGNGGRVGGGGVFLMCDH